MPLIWTASLSLGLLAVQRWEPETAGREIGIISTSFFPDAEMLQLAERLPRWEVMSPMVARTIRLRI